MEWYLMVYVICGDFDFSCIVFKVERVMSMIFKGVKVILVIVGVWGEFLKNCFFLEI